MLIKLFEEATSLEEFYSLLTEAKEENILQKSNRKDIQPLTLRHYHGLIEKYMQNCESYTEFGVCQGPTLATALFTKPKKIRAYDITLTWFNPAKELFEDYAKNNNIDFKIYETNTAQCNIIEPVDMLHIDSNHTYDHCKQELEKHALQVNKYILFHDTTLCPGVFQAVQEYIKQNDIWTIVEKSDIGVGYTVLARK